MQITHLIVGGGSAGCVLANRLSADPRHSVMLVEAGTDYTAGQTPEDILDTYAGRALGNRSYFWDLQVRRGADVPHLDDAQRKPLRYEQARVIGGGSSINGQVALRGMPLDFNRWHALGATGWDWDGVLPYFRKLESDLHFPGDMHGSDGPIPIRRFFREDWDRFTHAVAREWEREGFGYMPDLNGMWDDGFAPIPVSNDGSKRVSTAMGYLTDAVRARPNLQIVSGTEVLRLVLQGTRTTGVEVRDASGTQRVIDADNVILSAGVFRSPWLLMASGIGPGAHLAERGVAVVLDRAGVGRNLQDHPLLSISSYLSREARANGASRRNFAYLRYTSGMAPGWDSDMIMMAVCRSSWHAIGQRIGTLSANLAYAYSRGSVSLAPAGAAAGPDVSFNWLADARDRARMMDAFRRMARIYATAGVSQFASHPFPSSYSARVRLIQQNTFRNAALTQLGAAVMESSPLLRKFIIRNIIQDAPPVADLLRDEGALEAYVCANVGSTFHPVGTCRMGAETDAQSVVDPKGRVIGAQNLYVADASVMPEITRTNTNLPAIMIGEKMADLIAAA